MHRPDLALILLLAAGCNLPRDADHTLEHIRNGPLRVGIVHNPPWVIDSGGRIAGVEPQLVEALARDLGASPVWISGTESELLSQLHDRELDLVIGGLTAESPWKKEVAFTRVYYQDSTLVALPADLARSRDLKGDSIAIQRGDPAIVPLRKKGAVPVPTNDLARVEGPIAAPGWKLAALGRPATGVMLHAAKHVMATAPGENAWLNLLEHWLHQQKASIPAMLRASAQ
jgi:polar amino acid transport system substrate-binding protein